MSTKIRVDYQQLHFRLTALFSACVLVIIVIYTSMIGLSQQWARFVFERDIDERLLGATIEGKRHQGFLPQLFSSSPECVGEKQLPTSEPGDEPEPMLQIKEIVQPRQLSVPVVVRSSFARYAQQVWLTLLIFDLLIWLLATLAGYFLTGWLIAPARRAAQDQEDFLANASHELKTPITTIKTELALLAAQKITPTVKSSFQVIKSENQALQNLVDKLLLATTHQDQARTRFELVGLVKGRVNIYQKNYAARGLRFTYQGVSELSVVQDQGKLTQILDLLLDNAGKYADTGTSVKLRLKVVGKQGVVQVVNQGLGIAASEREKIFQRFYRVTNKKVQLQAGSGLGLAIARDLASQIEGELTLVSGAASATCFQLVFPVTS